MEQLQDMQVADGFQRRDGFVGKCAGVGGRHCLFQFFLCIVRQEQAENVCGILLIRLIQDAVQVCFFRSQIRSDKQAAVAGDACQDRFSGTCLNPLVSC